jgi:hypothetical protein
MKLYAWIDLRNRVTPRLDAFHTVDAATGKVSGVNYWGKVYLDPVKGF